MRLDRTRFIRGYHLGGPFKIDEVERFIRQKHPSYSNIEVVVETGTDCAETATGLSFYFKKIVTIEILREVFEQAVLKGKDKSNIDFRHGDSAVLLPQILGNMDEKPILFYLDAHSEAGEKNTPLLAELKAINRLRNSFDVIVVDDVRCFGLKFPRLDWTGITEESVLACLDQDKIFDEFIAEDKMYIFVKPHSRVARKPTCFSCGRNCNHNPLIY